MSSFKFLTEYLTVYDEFRWLILYQIVIVFKHIAYKENWWGDSCYGGRPTTFVLRELYSSKCSAVQFLMPSSMILWNYHHVMLRLSKFLYLCSGKVLMNLYTFVFFSYRTYVSVYLFFSIRYC